MDSRGQEVLGSEPGQTGLTPDHRRRASWRSRKLAQEARIRSQSARESEMSRADGFKDCYSSCDLCIIWLRRSRRRISTRRSLSPQRSCLENFASFACSAFELFLRAPLPPRRRAEGRRTVVNGRPRHLGPTAGSQQTASYSRKDTPPPWDPQHSEKPSRAFANGR